MTAYKVFVTKQVDDQYTARALMPPDIVSSGSSESEAIELLQHALADIQARSRVIEIDVPASINDSDDTWLPFIGIWEHDPDWDLFQEEVAAYRAEIDAKR